MGKAKEKGTAAKAVGGRKGRGGGGGGEGGGGLRLSTQLEKSTRNSNGKWMCPGLLVPLTEHWRSAPIYHLRPSELLHILTHYPVQGPCILASDPAYLAFLRDQFQSSASPTSTTSTSTSTAEVADLHTFLAYSLPHPSLAPLHPLLDPAKIDSAKILAPSVFFHLWKHSFSSPSSLSSSSSLRSAPARFPHVAAFFCSAQFLSSYPSNDRRDAAHDDHQEDGERDEDEDEDEEMRTRRMERDREEQAVAGMLGEAHVLYSWAGDRRTYRAFWDMLTRRMSCEEHPSCFGKSAIARSAIAHDPELVREWARTLGTQRRIARIRDLLADVVPLHFWSADVDSSPGNEDSAGHGASDEREQQRQHQRESVQERRDEEWDYVHIDRNVGSGASGLLPHHKSTKRSGGGSDGGASCSCVMLRNAPSSVTVVNCLACENRALMLECDVHSHGYGGWCGNQRLRRGEYARMELFRTEDGRGVGVRAAGCVQTGQLVVEYCGVVRTRSAYERDLGRYRKMGKLQYAMDLDATHVIDATEKGNWGRFLNHSCAPNCKTQIWTVDGQPRVGIYAIRDIPTGEELTYDYRFEWFSKDGVESCRCGAPNCRGIIGTIRNHAASGVSLASPSLAETSKNASQSKNKNKNKNKNKVKDRDMDKDKDKKGAAGAQIKVDAFFRAARKSPSSSSTTINRTKSA
eukprot:ANDGO_07359.mRNA.1 Histone-lysine N-methyltransferase